jgi:hypothetical protein
MEVHQGIATDYGQDKFDVSLDETDLARLANEYGFYGSPSENGLTTLQAWVLLTLEAERFVLVQSPKYGRDMAQVVTQIQANREQFATILVEVTGLELGECRKRAGLVDDPTP